MTSHIDTAFEEAQAGYEEGGIPIGAVLVSSSGKVLGRGHNQRIQKGSPTLHAEIAALENAGRLSRAELDGATMYTSLSPCIMCSGAILLYKIKKVVVGENTTFMGAEQLLKDNGVDVVVVNHGGCQELMQKYVDENKAAWNEDIGE